MLFDPNEFIYLFISSYLEKEHMRHCVPSNISSGLFNRPLKYVFTDGKPNISQPTVRNLSTGEIISGPQTYASILSFFTTSDITPEEVNKKGWEMVNKTYPQVLRIVILKKFAIRTPKYRNKALGY